MHKYWQKQYLIATFVSIFFIVTLCLFNFSNFDKETKLYITLIQWTDLFTYCILYLFLQVLNVDNYRKHTKNKNKAAKILLIIEYVKIVSSLSEFGFEILGIVYEQ